MRYVIYYRVSTNKQGVSGLGLEAQEQQVQMYLQSKSNVEIIGTFTEIDSGRKANRIELNNAVALAKKHKATLLVAKLDRIARNVRLFLRTPDTVNSFCKFEACFQSKRLVPINIAVEASKW
ncbi:recombinase family protein (plasmid) [Acinetobacter colistiniresistens]|uniref:recombinase family protein n=1 Tax=Acinetobacter colistiniresistens TaxID=280145 RepID=UPI00211CABDB|nr:recombinase family protein [Acinetobacter colistiniresistens]UUM29390.1 recombinase family protein [Acinetobacter colistiniresistens]